jgi:hypothetical protein
MKLKSPLPVFTLPRSSEWPIPHAYRVPEPRLRRDDVIDAYVHPAPTVVGRPVQDGDPIPAAARSLIKRAEAEGFEVRSTYAHGTTLPTWRVNAPDSKPNPGPAVHPSQYHGDDADSVRVVGHHRQRGGFIAYWVNGKSAGVDVHSPGDMLRPTGITHLMRKLAGPSNLSVHPDE